MIKRYLSVLLIVGVIIVGVFGIGGGIGFLVPVSLDVYDGSFYFYSGYGALKYLFKPEKAFSPYVTVNAGLNYFNGNSTFKEDFFNQVKSDIGSGFGDKKIGYYILAGMGAAIAHDFLVELSFSLNTGNISQKSEDNIYIMNYSRISLALGFTF